MKNGYYIILFAFFILAFTCITAQDKQRLVELLESLNQVTEESSEITILLEISEEYKKSDLTKSMEYGKHALALAERSVNKQLELQSIFSIAEIYSRLHQLDSSQYFLDNILNQEEQISDKIFLGNVYSLYGKILKNRGEYKKAHSFLLSGIKLHKEQGYHKGIADSYNRIAVIFQSRNITDSSLLYSFRAQEEYRLAGDSIGIVKTLGNAGKSFIKLGEYVKAKKYFLQALDILKYKKHLIFEAAVFNNLGNIYTGLQDYDSALYYYQNALELNRSANLKEGIGNAIMNMGVVYENNKQNKEAYQQFNEALKIFSEINSVSGIIKAKSNIALIHERWGNYNTAISIYDSLLLLCKEFEYGDLLEHTYFNIYKTYELAGNYNLAFKYMSIYQGVKDSLFNLEKAEIITNLELKYEKEKDEAKILMLQNRNLKKDLTLKKEKNQRYLIVAISTVLVLILLILFQRSRKNKLLAEKEIARLKEEKKALAAKALVEGQEKERKRVASELHDGLGVMLSNVRLQFSSFIDKNPENKNLLGKASDVLQKASDDVRRISHNMMPGVLMNMGLFEALLDLIEDINDGGLTKAELKIIGEEIKLKENTEIILYRIFQEMLNNSLKHAESSNISVIINNKADSIYIQYADNGQGFDIISQQKKKSLGLQSIRYRIEFLGGEVELNTSLGKGVSYSIYIPL